MIPATVRASSSSQLAHTAGGEGRGMLRARVQAGTGLQAAGRGTGEIPSAKNGLWDSFPAHTGREWLPQHHIHPHPAPKPECQLPKPGMCRVRGLCSPLAFRYSSCFSLPKEQLRLVGLLSCSLIVNVLPWLASVFPNTAHWMSPSAKGHVIVTVVPEISTSNFPWEDTPMRKEIKGKTQIFLPDF